MFLFAIFFFFFPIIYHNITEVCRILCFPFDRMRLSDAIIEYDILILIFMFILLEKLYGSCS